MGLLSEARELIESAENLESDSLHIQRSKWYSSRNAWLARYAERGKAKVRIEGGGDFEGDPQESYLWYSSSDDGYTIRPHSPVLSRKAAIADAKRVAELLEIEAEIIEG